MVLRLSKPAEKVANGLLLLFQFLSRSRVIVILYNSTSHFLNAGVTEVFVFFRLMNFLDVVSVLGPLQLAVKRMLSDVAKLMLLLLIILLG